MFQATTEDWLNATKDMHISAIPLYQTRDFTFVAPRGRVPGSAKGKVWVSGDFDDPLDDFTEYMEGQEAT